MIRNYKKGFTHGGQMHADEIFASAFLRMIDPSFEIERQFNRLDDIPDDKDILVFDIGLSTYDHHQKDALLRPNGKKYASAGLILNDFWQDMGLSKEQFEFLDKSLVSKIDEVDNYGGIFDISFIIGNFNIFWKDSNGLNEEELFEKQNSSFESAINFAITIIRAYLNYFKNDKINNKFCFIEEIYIDAFLDIANASNEDISDCENFYDIVEKYKENIFKEGQETLFLEFANKINNLFFKHNFKAGYIYLINCYRLKNYEQREMAFSTIKIILKKEIEKSINEALAKERVNELIQESKSNYLILNENLPWFRCVCDYNEKYNKIDFVILINPNHTCGIRGVPKSFYLKNSLRIYFPEEIRGKDIETLQDFSEGLLFCHESGFFSMTDNLDNAIKLIEKISNLGEKNVSL